MEKLIKKPHAVCIPFPLQSHINAMLMFAKLLHHKGFHITFVHTEYNYNRTLKSRGPNSLDGSSNFKFETIPDGLPPAAIQDAFQLGISCGKNCLAPFLQLLKNLNHKASMEDGDDSPPVTCVISDSFMFFTIEASEELGIPNAQLWTVNAGYAMFTLHVPHIVERGYVPLKDESYLTNGYLDQTYIDLIPGVNSIRLRDLPMLWTADPNQELLKFMLDLVPKTLKGSAHIINTFDSLECDVLKKFSSMVDNLYTVGPIHLVQREIQDEYSINTESIQSNLWKEDDSLIEWLNSKEKGSVAYVNFGSIAVMTEDQLVECAWGIANSMRNFLWIIRPDLVVGGPVVLPPEFLKATRDRGMISTWCNQELVLNHPSVGVFLTHCGWNSILESLSAGVPLICLPFIGDQPINCLYCCLYWGVGVEIDSNVDRVEVEKVIRVVMEGEKGMEMKKKALEWKNRAEEAIKPGVGSSCLNLEKLIQDVLLQPKTES